MDEPMLTSEGRQLLDKILSLWPPIIHQRKKGKIIRMVSLLMREKEISEAGSDVVIEAAKFVIPKSYDPLFHMWEDPSIWQRFLATFEDMDAYNAIRVQVRRWEPAKTKPAKTPDQMKVIAFCASPRKHGNTSLLIDEALKGVRSVGAQGEKIMLQQIRMSYCIGCRRCKDPDYDGICIVKDDMTDLCGKIVDTDAIIVGFPIYTGRECAQLSTFLDRWDCFERFRLKAGLAPGKRALVIGTWGYDHIDTYDHVIENIISVLNLHKVVTVEAISACGFEGMLHGLDESKVGVIARYPEEMKKAFDAGVGLVTG
jgi:multimeric flavodoxin WrbA